MVGEEYVFAVSSKRDSLVAFLRDEEGKLTCVERLENGYRDVQGLENPNSLVLSPDGSRLYAGSSGDGAGERGGIAVFDCLPEESPSTQFTVGFTNIEGLTVTTEDDDDYVRQLKPAKYENASGEEGFVQTTINTGGGQDTVDLKECGGTITVNTGADGDEITARCGEGLGSLTVHAGLGSDTIDVVHTGTAGTLHIYTDHDPSDTDPGQRVLVGDVDDNDRLTLFTLGSELDIETGPGPDRVTLLRLGATSTVRTGGGDDYIEIARTDSGATTEIWAEGGKDEIKVYGTMLESEIKVHGGDPPSDPVDTLVFIAGLVTPEGSQETPDGEVNVPGRSAVYYWGIEDLKVIGLSEPDAGADQSISEGSILQLSAAASTIPPGRSVRFDWDLDSDGYYGDRTGISTELTWADLVGCGMGDNGEYTVSVRLTDVTEATGDPVLDAPIGKETFAFAIIEITNVAPVVQSIAATPTQENDQATLSGTFSDLGTLDTFILKVDWGDGTDPELFSYPAGTDSFHQTHQYLDDKSGVYTIDVTLTDDDGHSHEVSTSVAVENLDPTAYIAGPDQGFEGSSVSLAGYATDPGPNDLVALSWEVKKNDVFFEQGVGETFEFTPDDKGIYVVVMTASDGDGGSDTADLTVNVANLAPVVTGLSLDETTIDESGYVTLSGDFSDAGELDTHAVKIDWGDDSDPDGDGQVGESIALSADAILFEATHLYADDKPGGYQITVTVADEDGGWDKAVTRVEVMNVTPTVEADAAMVTVDESLPAANTGIFDDLGDDTVTITTSVGMVEQDDVSKTWSWSYTPGDGPADGRTVTITAEDDDGGVSSTTFDLVVQNVAPTVVVGPGATITEGSEFSGSGSFADPGADNWTATIDYGDGSGGQPLSLREDKTFTLNHVYADNGVYEVTVTVADKDGDQGKDSTSVEVINAAPTAYIAGPSMGFEGSCVSLVGYATDPGPNDLVTLSWEVKKNDIFFTDGVGERIEFTPDDESDYTVVLTADDGDSSDTAEMTVIVANQAPSVGVDYGTVTVYEGQESVNPVTFFDPGKHDTVSISASPGSVEDNGDGSWSWSWDTTDGPAESRTVTITATDNGGDATSTTFELIVKNVAPTVVTGPDVTINEGSPFSRGGWFVDPGADTWTATVDYGDGSGEQPLELGQDKTFTLSHVYADNGEYAVRVKVADKDGAVSSSRFDATVLNVLPEMADLIFDTTTLDESGTVNLSGSFSDLGTEDTHTVLIDWGDGKNSSATVDQAANTFSASHQYLDDKPGGQAISFASSSATVNQVASKLMAGYQDLVDQPGEYTIRVTLIDEDDGRHEISQSIVVANLAPIVIAGPAATIDEGGQFSGEGSFTDPGADSWTATVDYGDGSGDQPLTLGADKTFDLSYVYADDGVYPVTVTVTDDEDAPGSFSFDVTVLNVAPTVEADAAEVTADEASPATNTGTFDDFGTDTVTITASIGTLEQDNAAKTWSWSYTPADGPAESQEVTITADDNEGGVGTTTFDLLVENVAPTVTAGPAATIDEGSLFTGEGSFADLGADSWTATVDYGDGSGDQPLALEVDTTFNLSYVYADDGVYPVTVKVTDDEGGVGSASFDVTVLNVAPTVVVTVDRTIDADDLFSLTVADFNDLGTLDWHSATIDWGDGSPLEDGVVDETPFGPPGSMAGADGTVSGTHVYAEAGVYTVTVTVVDDEGASAGGTFAATVLDANLPPVAYEQQLDMAEDTGLAIVLTASDPNLPEDTITFSIVVDPDHGTLSGSGDTRTYTPANNYHGSDQFTYRVTDQDGLFSEAVISLTVTPVNDPPLVENETYEVDEDTPLVIDAANGVLANATDVDKDKLAASRLGGPEHGVLKLAADGSFEYVPASDFNGVDRFTYLVDDGHGGQSLATATIIVHPVDDPLVSQNGIVYVPETPDETVSLYFEWTFREARFDNEVWAYVVDDPSGAVNGIPPSSPAYAQTVFADADWWLLFRSGESAGAARDLAVAGGTHLAFYIIQDDTNQALQQSNPDNVIYADPLAFFSINAANPDHFSHVHVRELPEDGYEFSWEDLTFGGDRDFDDVVFTVNTVPGVSQLSDPVEPYGPVAAHSLGTLDQMELFEPDLSIRETWYRFRTANKGTLTLEASSESPVDDVQLSLYDEPHGDPPLATSTGAMGNRRIDWPTEAGVTYYLKVTGTATDVILRLANLFHQDGSTLTVYGTEGDDLFELLAGAPLGRWAVSVNGVIQEAAAGTDSLVVDGLGGYDTVNLVSLAAGGDDSAELWPDHGTFITDGVTSTLAGVESIKIDGGAGTDTVVIHDSVGDDAVHARAQSSLQPVGSITVSDFDIDDPGYVSTYAHSLAGFEVLTACSSEGTDVASFYDSDGDDEFIAKQFETVLSGDGFRFRAENFQYTHGYAKAGGDDRAELYDTPKHDRFKASPIYARMFRGAFQRRAKFFETVVAYADSGGARDRDDARLFDSIGNDEFFATPTESRLHSASVGYDVSVVSFDRVLVRASTGQDTATFSGGSGNDLLVHKWIRLDTMEKSPKTEMMDFETKGEVYKITARRFGRTTALDGGAGYDVAKFWDTLEDDRFVVGGDSAVVYSPFDELLYDAVAFEKIVFNHVNGGNNKTEEASAVDFALSEYWAP